MNEELLARFAQEAAHCNQQSRNGLIALMFSARMLWLIASRSKVMPWCKNIALNPAMGPSMFAGLLASRFPMAAGWSLRSP